MRRRRWAGAGKDGGMDLSTLLLRLSLTARWRLRERWVLCGIGEEVQAGQASKTMVDSGELFINYLPNH